MVKGMDKIMLNCDQATLLATKDSFEKIGCVKKFQLQMHLLGCKFCRSFVKQSKFIDEQLKGNKITDHEELNLQLSVNQKERIQSVVEENIK